MELFLIQHGVAKSKEEDPARPLTEAGAAAVEAMAARLAAAGVAVTEIRHSGKRRAEETAEIFARHLSPPKGAAAVTGLGPMDDPRPTAEDLGEYLGALMLVGHLPFMSRLAGLLIAGDPEREAVRFRNAGVVCLRSEAGVWSVAWALVPDLAES